MIDTDRLTASDRCQRSWRRNRWCKCDV